MKKVAVLLSSYNGERYIEEQIESILEQTYKNMTLYIRDDCSKDNTASILRKYEGNEKIVILKGEKNLGYPEAFYEMMREIKEYDFYAFSDQDDVWNPDKIESAIKILENSNPDKPCLLFSNYDIVDENLRYIRTSIGPKETPGFNYSIFSSIGLGFTYVLNDKLKKLVLERRSKKTVTKDVWIGMLAAAFGVVEYDSNSTAKHRRNSGAFSAQDKTFLSIQKDRFRRFFLNDGFEYVKNVMDEFYEMFENKMSESDRKMLALFVNRSKNPFHVLKKVCYPKRLRYDIKDEIALRFVFLIGKL